MCIPTQQSAGKTRRIRVIANTSLVIGIVLIHFVHPTSQLARDLSHGIGGLLIGLSIGLNLLGLRCARRCRPAQE